MRFGGAATSVGIVGEGEVGVKGASNGLDNILEVADIGEEEAEETILPMLTLSLDEASSSSGVADTLSFTYSTTSLPTFTLALESDLTRTLALAFELALDLAPAPSASRKRSPTLGTLKIAFGGGGSSTSITPYERVCFSCCWCWRFALIGKVAFTFAFGIAPPPTFTFTPPQTTPPPPTPGAPCKNPESIVDVVDEEWWWKCPATPAPALEALALLSISLNRARSAESASSLARLEDRFLVRLGWRLGASR